MKSHLTGISLVLGVCIILVYGLYGVQSWDKYPGRRPMVALNETHGSHNVIMPHLGNETEKAALGQASWKVKMP